MNRELQEEIACAILASKAVKYGNNGREIMKENYRHCRLKKISPIPSAILSEKAIEYGDDGKDLLHKLFNEFKEIGF